MKHPPLKRHPSLQPFSRDHYVGLVQAQHLQRAAGANHGERLRMLNEFIQKWTGEIKPHLLDEERLLIPLLEDAALISRLRREHQALDALARRGARLVADGIAPERSWMEHLGRMLHDHIRWEERELFPLIEERSPAASLVGLKRETDVIEDSRPRWDRAPDARSR